MRGIDPGILVIVGISGALLVTAFVLLWRFL